MTCINQYMKEHPYVTLSEVINNYCPCEFYNIDEFEGCAYETEGDCESCWNREIPDELEYKKENSIMTCREKLITEHPEWSEVIIMKCTDIYTPNEYFTIDGPELLWSDIYPGVVEECSEDEDEKDAKIKQLESDKDALSNELIEKRKRVAELVEAYSASLNEIDILKEKNDNQRSIIEGNRETINNLHNQIQDLLEKIELRDEEIDKLVKENERLRKSADILSDGIDRRENENTGLYNKVTELDRTIEEQEEKIKLRDEEIDKLVKENTRLLGLVEASRKRNDSLEANWRVCSDENKILRVEKATQAESIKDLLESNDKFKEDIESRNREIAKHVMEITELMTTVKAKDKQISELVDLENRIRNRDEEIDRLVKENDELLNALGMKSDYNKSLNSMLNDRIEKYQTLRANIEMMGFEVGDDNTIIVRPDKPHFATREIVEKIKPMKYRDIRWSYAAEVSGSN